MKSQMKSMRGTRYQRGMWVNEHIDNIQDKKRLESGSFSLKHIFISIIRKCNRSKYNFQAHQLSSHYTCRFCPPSSLLVVVAGPNMEFVVVSVVEPVYSNFVAVFHHLHEIGDQNKLVEQGDVVVTFFNNSNGLTNRNSNNL
jgi:hypothetical protein